MHPIEKGRAAHRWFSRNAGQGLLLGLCWIFAAAQALAHGDLHVEIERVTSQLKSAPGRADLYWFRANLYFQHGLWNDALDDLENVDRFSPGAYPTDLLRGEARAVGGDHKSARLALDRFLSAHPENAQALMVRARVLNNLGEQAASIADYRAALKASKAPEPDLYLEVANALAAAGAGPEAVQALDRGLKSLGAIPSLAIRAIELKIAQGRGGEALELIAQMQKSAPRPEPWMAKRAGVLAQIGRAEEARAAWQALIDHLAALPNLERGSHAMVMLAEEARQALILLSSPPADYSPPPNETHP